MKANLKLRKTILLVSILILAVIYGCQLVFSSFSTVKTYKLKESPDYISIENGENKVELFLEGGLWYVGEKKEAADDQKVNELVEVFNSIKTLETVSKNADEAALERYGFTGSEIIKAVAKKENKILRQIEIGKTGASSSTVYIKLDSSKDVLLCAQDLKDIFSKTEEDYKFKAEETTEEIPTPEQNTEEQEVSTSNI